MRANCSACCVVIWGENDGWTGRPGQAEDVRDRVDGFVFLLYQV